MYKNKKISLVIPCRNEAKNLVALSKFIPKIIDEVLVIDNNSTDNTPEVARSLGFIVHYDNRVDQNGIGYGYAHQTGIKKAKGDYIVTIDGDNTYPLNDLKKILDIMINENLGFVSCNRLPLKTPGGISRTRKLGIMILNFTVLFFHKLKLKDCLSGMWVIETRKAKELHLIEGGWNFSMEIKLKAFSNKNFASHEYHIRHDNRTHEPSKLKIWKAGFDYLIYVIKTAF